MKLESKNLVLRKALESDLDAIYHNCWSYDEVARFMIWKPLKSIEEAKTRLNETIEMHKHNLSFFVCLKATNEAIGYAGIKLLRPGVYSDAGLCIGPKYQGFGYGKELVALLLKFAFIDLKADEFIYGCMSHNEKSKNLCKRFSFEYFESKEMIRPWDNYLFIDDRHFLKKELYLQEVYPKYSSLLN